VNRMHGEPVDVRLQDGKPARFVWRGRLFTVLVVLDRWMTSREWWIARHPDPGAPAEREFWRVEAVPERTPNSGIYDLCFDWSGGHWHLIRVED